MDMRISEYRSIAMEDTARLFQALAETSRLRLLKCLQVRPACVCELMQATGMSQTRVSRHLRVLREAGLVGDAREAQWVIYSLAQPPVGALGGQLLALLEEWGEDKEQVSADRQRLAAATRAEDSRIALKASEPQGTVSTGEAL